MSIARFRAVVVTAARDNEISLPASAAKGRPRRRGRAYTAASGTCGPRPSG